MGRIPRSVERISSYIVVNKRFITDYVVFTSGMCLVTNCIYCIVLKSCLLFILQHCFEG